MVKKENKLEEKNEELVNDIKRLQAEFDNYRRREEQNKKATIETATRRVIERMIPVLDTFELAIKSSPEGTAKQGMEMIYSQTLAALQEEGLAKIEPLNEQFNPEEHEAIMKTEGKENKILEVIQSGYKLHNVIIRHAKVKIGGQQK